MSRSSTTSLFASKDAPDKALEPAEKAAIEQFKRSGDFDAIRKDTLRAWEASEAGATFLKKLQAIASSELERDQSLLARDRGKAATLVGGAVERTNLYHETRIAAAKNIFQTEEFRQRIYESIKKYMPDTTTKETGHEKDPDNVQNGGKTTAREAVDAFMKREAGR